MSYLTSELKAVTISTSFSAVRVFDEGKEKYALIDQNGHIVGLVERDYPYFINGSFSDALTAAKKGLRNGATYKAYPCSKFGQHHYVLDTNLEPVKEFSDIPEVKACQEIANSAIELLNKVKATNKRSGPRLTKEKIVN